MTTCSLRLSPVALIRAGALLLALSTLAFASGASQEVSPIPTPAASPNLVPNPTFEDAGDALPRAWTAGAPRPDISAEFTADDQRARSGRRSLCISGAGKAGAIGWATARCSGIEPGATYELVAYVRGEEIPSLHESAWVKLTWRRGADDDSLRVAYLHALERAGEWWRISGTLIAPEGAASADITLGLRGAPSHARLWWDDISLHRVPTPAPRRLRIATAYLPSDKRPDPQAWRDIIEQAGEGKADVVCLGEMAAVIEEGPDARPTIPGPATDLLGGLARRYHMMIIVSIPDWQGPLMFNTAVIIGRNGEIVGRYRKTHLPQSEVEGGSAAGATLPVFDTDIGRIGIQICYDYFFPEVSRVLALEGAEIIFTPIWGDGRAGNQAYEAVARTRAIDNTVYHVTSTYNLRSLIIDPDGTVLADTAGTPGVVFADIDLDAPRYERWLSVEGSAEFRLLWPKERRPSLYRRLVEDD